MAPAGLKKNRNKQRKAKKKAKLEKENEKAAKEKQEQHNKSHQQQDGEEDSIKEKELVPDKLTKIKWPSLTAGSIKRILGGEDVSGAVMQILGYQKIPSGEMNVLRLLISDGVTRFSDAVLTSQLYSLVAKELENFTIVRVDEYDCRQVRPNRKVIILLNLTVLAPGAEVIEKIGDPISLFNMPSAANAAKNASNATTQKITINVDLKTNHISRINSNVQAVPPAASLTAYKHQPTKILTAGSINRILGGEEVFEAVMQILACRKIRGNYCDRYRLLISDGVTSCHFVVLGTQLNSLVTSRKLEQFTIFRVDKYICKQVQLDRKFITLLNLTVLVPGAEVKEKIGNPICSSNTSGATTDASYTPDSVSNTEPKTKHTSQIDGSVQSEHPVANLTTSYQKEPTKCLTAGSINRILSGEDVSGAVIQILDCEKIPVIYPERYRLFISDGVIGCPIAMLGTQLNSLVANKELEKFTIVRVDECVCNQIQPDRKIIILLNLTVLVPGAEVNEKIGNPINSSNASTSDATTDS